MLPPPPPTHTHTHTPAHPSPPHTHTHSHQLIPPPHTHTHTHTSSSLPHTHTHTLTPAHPSPTHTHQLIPPPHTHTHQLTRTTHLEKVVSLKLLKDGPFELYKVVGHHDGEQHLAVGVDGHVECGRLDEDQDRMENWERRG